MNISETVKWQWDGYTKYHQSPANLWIHILFVPIFIYGAIYSIVALINLNIIGLVVSTLLMITSIGIQGIGHKKEQNPAEPFTSAKNVIIRIFFEQLYTFPKILISGRWYKALRGQQKPN
jgi:uncharacterized membrane protein